MGVLMDSVPAYVPPASSATVCNRSRSLTVLSMFGSLVRRKEGRSGNEFCIHNTAATSNIDQSATSTILSFASGNASLPQASNARPYFCTSRMSSGSAQESPTCLQAPAFHSQLYVLTRNLYVITIVVTAGLHIQRLRPSQGIPPDSVIAVRLWPRYTRIKEWVVGQPKVHEQESLLHPELRTVIAFQYLPCRLGHRSGCAETSLKENYLRRTAASSGARRRYSIGRHQFKGAERRLGCPAYAPRWN